MMVNSKRLGWWFFLMFVCLTAPITQAAPIEGSCGQRDTAKTDGDGKLIEPKKARVMQSSLMLYEDRELSKPMEQKLELNKHVLLTGRNVTTANKLVFEVRYPGQDTAGWVDANGLLCERIPLAHPSGLDQRLFVDTTNAQPVPVYARSDSDDCGGSQCGELRRFEWVSAYAYDEANERYLVSFRPNLMDDSHNLLGWVMKKNLLEWPTSLALKPQDCKKDATGNGYCFDKRYHDADPIIIEQKRVKKPDETAEQQQVSESTIDSPLKNYAEWYSVDKLLPILNHDKERKVYTIASPRNGIPFEDVLKYFPKLENTLSNVDVFFVLDGTESMDPYLADVKQWVSDFAKQLSSKPTLAGMSFRFGFRVFRDQGHDAAFACQKGICEGLTLNSKTTECSPPPSPDGQVDDGIKRWSQASLEKFQRELEPVKAATPGNTLDKDFEERLSATLQSVLESDLQGCNERVKLVFVIGDHGDTVGRFASVDPDIELALTNHYKRLELFFLQVPNSRPGSKEAEAAYQQFSVQAQKTLRNLLALREKDGLTGGRVEDYFHSLDNGNATQADTVLDIVSAKIGVFDKAAIEKLRDDILKGGDQSKPLLDAIRKTGQYSVFQIQVAKDMLGKKFDSDTLSDVALFEVPADDALVERYAWRTSKGLNDLTSLLQPFDTFALNTQGNPGEKRKALVKLLDEQIKAITGSSSGDGDGGYDKTKTLQQLRDEYMDKGGRIQKALPLSAFSPLLQYSVADLENPDIVRTDCELEALVQRVIKSREALLQLSQNPREALDYEQEPAMHDTCGQPKGEGKHTITKVKLGSNSDRSSLAPQGAEQPEQYSYCRQTASDKVCWIPLAILP